jgi:hypothetical protein
MAKLKKEDIDEKVDLIASNLGFDGMQVWLEKDKLPESAVKAEFGGTIPDELKDKVVPDEEFKKLIEEVKKEKENQENKQEDNSKQESTNNVIKEIPKIENNDEEEEEEKTNVSPQVKTYSKSVSKDTGIPESIVSQYISKMVNEDEITKLSKLADLGKKLPPNSNVSQTIYDAALGKQIMQNIAKEKETLSAKELLDRIFTLKAIEALSPQPPPPQQSMSLEEILKFVIALTQMQRPQDNKQEILSIVEKISNQQAQLTERIFNQMKEMNEKTITLINQLVEKSNNGYTKDDLKKLADALAQSKENKIDAKSIAEEIERQSKNAIELLKALGYKVDKGENAIENIDKIFNSKLGDTLLNLISNPDKIGQIANAIRKSPAKSIPTDVSEMPSI